MILLEDIGNDKIDLIKDLWEMNRRHHEATSEYFGSKYKALGFEERISRFRRMDGGNVLITIVRDDAEIVGYCLSSREGEAGELCSMHIKREYRGKGIGQSLARRHLEWMKEGGCATIKVVVSQENETALRFYGSLGFRPNTIEMELAD